jgi:hypothetical protein
MQAERHNMYKATCSAASQLPHVTGFVGLPHRSGMPFSVRAYF